MAFECPDCGMVPHSPQDAEHGYCGACGTFPEHRPRPAVRLVPCAEGREAEEAAAFREMARLLGDTLLGDTGPPPR